MGYNPWCCKEWYMTEQHFDFSYILVIFNVNANIGLH